MALILADRVKETSTTTGNGVFTLAGAASGFQSFAVIGNGNTTYYCIAGQGTNEWEVGIGTYATSGTTLTRTTVLSNSSATQPSALSFAAGTKDVFVTYPAEKSVNLNASGNASALGTPVAFVGTNITGTASGLTAGNVTTNANLTGGVTSVGNAATVVTNANLTGGVTSVGNAATVVTNANLTGGVTSVGNAATVITNANLTGGVTSVGNAATVITNANLTGDATSVGNATTVVKLNGTTLSALATGILKNTTATGVPSIAVAADFPTLNQSTTGSAATLTTPRAIYGNNFDGSVALTQIIASTYGGTGNGFSKFSGAATTEKTYTLPNASTTILTTNAVVTEAQGGTNTGTYTTGDILYASAANTLSKLPAGTVNYVLTSGGAGVAPSWAVGGSGSGTVTSVAASVPSLLSISGSPITTSGTLAITYSGTALPEANGGTNQTAYTTGDILYASAANTLSKLPAGTANYVLTSNGANTAPSYQFAGNAGSTAYEEYPFTATAAQTTFAVGVSMTLVNVFLNGLRLLPTTDYSISGTDIVLTTGAAANDILSVLVYFNSVVGGTVTSVSVTPANGVSGSVATATTTPAITLTLGAITPSSVQVSGLTASEILSTDASKNLTSLAVATYPSLAELAYVKGVTSAIQTQINAKGAGTVTTASVVSANGFAGTVANPTTTPAITLTTSITGVLKGNGTAISAATSGTDYALGTSALATGILKSTTTTGALTIAIAADFPTLNQSTTGSAATLTTPRAIYGNNFDGSAALTQVIASTYGGTGNGFSKFSGATTAEKTYTLPNASTTILTTNAAVTEAQGGTNQSTYTTGDLLYASAANTLSKLPAGTVNYVLTSGGAGVAPAWAVGSGMTLLATDTFSTPGTFTNGWSKNASAKLVVILNIGAGGGGASGGAACNTALGGQGGGGAGAVVRSVLPATILGSTETYVVGAKGTGGASVSRTAAGANASTVGNPGNAGTNSSFGSWSVSKGGAGGTVNTTNNSAAGGGLGPASTDTGVLLPIEFGGNGGDGGATDNAPLGTAASTTVGMSSGGGSGGGVGVSGTQVDGLGGGLAGSTTGGALGAGAGGAVNATGTAGGAGNVNASGTQSSGGGGGGNATSTGTTGLIVATAGAGGNAGGAGGGGGGGGAARVATTIGNQAISGKGGDGGDGKIVVYQFG